MNRRKFLLGSTFAAAAFCEPAVFALTVPPADNTARITGRRIGMPDVEMITEHIAHLRRLDFRHGSGRVREQVVQVLHREASTVMHTAPTRRRPAKLCSARSPKLHGWPVRWPPTSAATPWPSATTSSPSTSP
jgi:hypothetical protein